MNAEYPKKTCELEKLIRNRDSIEKALAGIKTQQRRDGVYGFPGEEFLLNGQKFVMTKLERRRLGDMTDADARAEGFESLAAYKGFIVGMHSGMTWNESAEVWVHHFKKAGG